MTYPLWLEDVSLMEILITVTFILGFLAVIGKLVKMIKPIHKAIEKFLEDWNGVPAELDNSGTEIKPAKPGMVASINEVKDQLQNDHGPINLRHDLDTKATIHQVDQVKGLISTLGLHLEEHIKLTNEKENAVESALNQLTSYLPSLKLLAEQTSHPEEQEMDNGSSV